VVKYEGLADVEDGENRLSFGMNGYGLIDPETGLHMSGLLLMTVTGRQKKSAVRLRAVHAVQCPVEPTRDLPTAQAPGYA
jgi:hypothetical protein